MPPHVRAQTPLPHPRHLSLSLSHTQAKTCADIRMHVYASIYAQAHTYFHSRQPKKHTNADVGRHAVIESVPNHLYKLLRHVAHQLCKATLLAMS
jgi:hypothetical protein